MKPQYLFILLIGTLLMVSPVAAQEPVNTGLPEYVPPVSFSDALKIMGDESVKSAFDRSGALAKEVDRRWVGFPLTQNVRLTLIQKGATEGVLSAIERAAKVRTEKIGLLYEEFSKEYADKQSIDAGRRAIALGRELRDTIGDPELLIMSERDLREVAHWFIDNLPKIEARLADRIKRGKDIPR